MSLLAMSLSAVGLVGCAANQEMVQSNAAELDQYKDQLAQAQAANQRLQQQLAAQESQASSAATTGATNNDAFPPNPQPGHCYARVLIPAEFETSTEQVEVRPASEKIAVVPAEFEWTTQTVLDKEASTKIVPVPATYKTATEKVLVQPASTRLETVPAKYKTDTQQVVDVAAHTEWKRGTTTVPGALKSTVDAETGDIMCLVEVPATYKTITKTVLVSPATVQEIEIPAEYETVTKTVVDTPATTRVVEIPATYKTIKIRKLLSPAKATKTSIPAEFDTVTSRKQVTAAEMKWREVVCETNMTSDLARAIQTKLKSAGYYKGPIDGAFGRMTMTASQRYSNAKNLPVGENYITLDMLNSLDISL